MVKVYKKTEDVMKNSLMYAREGLHFIDSKTINVRFVKQCVQKCVCVANYMNFDTRNNMCVVPLNVAVKISMSSKARLPANTKRETLIIAPTTCG